ncbi:MAG: ankyrin repeat domain-containing protein [Candidatus Babeliales bacterium]
MKPKLLNIALSLLFTISLQAMEVIKRPISEKYQAEADKLKDAYLQGKESIWYKEAKAKTTPSWFTKERSVIFAERNTNYALVFLGESMQLADHARMQSLGLKMACSKKSRSRLLHQAAESGYTAFCLFLLDAQILPINHRRNHENTPLHLAAVNGHLDTCALLLEHGASVSVQNCASRTPLQEIVLRPRTDEHRQCALLLRQHGAQLDFFETIYELPIDVDGLRKTKSERRTTLCNKEFSPANISMLSMRFPFLASLGLSLSEQDLTGRAMLHHIAKYIAKTVNQPQQKLPKVHMPDILKMVFVEQQLNEKRRALTVAAMHKYRHDSLWARLPRDVLKNHILPDIAPLMYNDEAGCIKQLLTRLKELLSLKDTQGKLPQDYAPDKQEIGTFFDPDKVSTKREAFEFFIKDQLLIMAARKTLLQK